MTETTRPFQLADILSVTTPVLFSRDLIGGLKGLLEWMTGAELHPWNFSHAADDCAPELIRQHPFVGALKPPADARKDDLAAWLADVEQRHPTVLDVAPLASWIAPDPVTSLIDKIELVSLYTTEDDR